MPINNINYQQVMKVHKKALAASIAILIQNKVKESGEQSVKAQKTIEKAAKKLVDKLVKISGKEKKKLKQAKKVEITSAKESKKLKELNSAPPITIDSSLNTVI